MEDKTLALLKKLREASDALDYGYLSLSHHGTHAIDGTQYDKINDVFIEVDEYLESLWIKDIKLIKWKDKIIINIQPYFKTKNSRLYQCDNLELLKELPNNYIDLIYCDILYNTGKKFADYDDKLGTPEEAMEWYKPRLIEIHRTLKETGNIYLQCDYRLVHYLKVEMDRIFGFDNFQNHIIWCYNGGGVTKKRFNKKHDDILFYSKTDKFIFNTQYQPYNENSAGRLKHKHKGEDKSDRVELGTPMVDWWSDIKCIVNPENVEYVNYNTQKPKGLLERIIKASSNEGQIVADFFMGSCTTGEVALELGRRFIGCDIGEKACEISKKRLESKVS